MTTTQWTICPSCDARVRDFDGATHEYIGAVAGCWEIFGEVLAREYEQPAYFAVHHLTVDAYAVQHPGTPSPHAIQSVGGHLISLYHELELGTGYQERIAAMKHASRIARERFTWLEPPADRGTITVLDVHAADSATAHQQIVRQWADTMWQAWSAHHDTIRQWATW
jgi:hypothetical protein